MLLFDPDRLQTATVASQAYDPLPDAGAVVLSGDGQARFTVLTSQLLRMEYSSRGRFEDRESYSFINR